MSPVCYEVIPGSGFLVFDCTRLRAALSPKACATNWTAQKTTQCAECDIGRHFAGGKPAHPKRTRVCLRCNQQARLVARCFCISCRNRAAEVWYGKNAKGKPPSKWTAILREGFAIIEMKSTQNALDSLYRTPGAISIRACMHHNTRPYIPIFEQLDDRHLWLECWTTGRPELEKVCARLFPESTVTDLEINPLTVRNPQHNHAQPL